MPFESYRQMGRRTFALYLIGGAISTLARVNTRSFLVIGAVVALVALLVFGLAKDGGARVAVGEDFPDAELPRLDGDGTGSLADYRGEWVFVNVWASWCVPCREESPDLQAFHERHEADNFTVLGIDSREIAQEGQEFVDEFGITYPQLHDGPGERPDDLGMVGFPESFLVDPDGKVALVVPGPVDEEYLRENVEPLIES
jgi:cytochrome c biogenesis protein CcmG/thiol:disulfide interchange protein DsbE